jgi:uncharacterized protein YodC (DUF2158 family)
MNTTKNTKDVTIKGKLTVERDQEENSTNKLSKGDLVKLHSGSPTMTVSNIAFGSVDVTYFYNGEVKKASFCLDCVRKVGR